ncbi:MAG: hypothetical protein U0168_04340 [Nannocystaceae bacterium]
MSTLASEGATRSIKRNTGAIARLRAMALDAPSRKRDLVLEPPRVSQHATDLGLRAQHRDQPVVVPRLDEVALRAHRRDRAVDAALAVITTTGSVVSTASIWWSRSMPSSPEVVSRE